MHQIIEDRLEFGKSSCGAYTLCWAKTQISTYRARYQHVLTFIISAAKDTALIYHLLQAEGRGLCTTASLWNALLMVILEANAVCSAWDLLNSSQTSSLLSLGYQGKLCSLHYLATQQLKIQMQSIEETEDSTKTKSTNPLIHSWKQTNKTPTTVWQIKSLRGNCYFQSLLLDWAKYCALQLTPEFS